MKTLKSFECSERLAAMHEALSDVAKSGQYTEGPKTAVVENALTTYLQRPTRVLNSCGSALLTAFVWLSQQKPKKVIIQSNTFYATGAMAVEAGFDVALCDSRRDCPSMSVESLKEVFSKFEASVVVLTHIGGWVAKDYAAIAAFCVEKGLILVEDCAHAFGTQGDGRPGSKGDIACWSFYATKAVPIGEGGAISTRSPELVAFAERYRSYGKWLQMGRVRYGAGMNLRMSEWAAATLLVQLNFLRQILQARRNDAERLQSIAPCLLRGETNWYKYPISWLNADGLKTVGKVYSKTDQLAHCLPQARKLVPLENSLLWADSHECLPIGENLYAGVEGMREYLIAEKVKIY